MPTQLVFGVVKSRDQAAAVIKDISRAGFSSNDISALVPETVPAGRGPSGDCLGLLTGLVPVTIPGLRPTLGAGPLVSALAGWSTAGVSRGLVALRIPEALARQYERQLGEGGILLAVQADERRDLDRLKTILLQHQAENVSGDEPERVSVRAARPPAVIAL